jgi:dATP pyrophosphohydrolase
VSDAKIPVSTLVVIHTPRLEVLLLERADRPGYWQSVTGSQDPGETLRETAVREVSEETGLDAGRYELTDWNLQNVYRNLSVWRHRYAPGVTHNTEHVFGLRRAASPTGARGPARAPRGRMGAVARRGRAVFSWSNRKAILDAADRPDPDMPRKRNLTVVTYNIHKGLSTFNKRLVLHDIKEGLRTLGRRRGLPAGGPGQARQERPAPRELARGLAARVPHPRGQPLRLRHERRLPARPPRQRGGEPPPDPGVGEHRHLAPPDREPRAAALRGPHGGMEGAAALHQRAPRPVGAQPALPARVVWSTASVPPCRRTGPLVVAGDFNDWQRKASEYLATELGLYEVFEKTEGRLAKSYPAQMPMFTLDRIYVRDLNIDSVQRHTGAPWSRLSDHVALAARLSR